MKKSYGTQAAADYIGVSKSFLDKRAAAGTGPAYRRAGKLRIYDEEDLDHYKSKTRVEPKEEPFTT
jgi:excisionase family DNA binding protein